eukprot:scaffold510_cov242-Pinguiococcus_pyrenoidosus.AAC.2
MRTGSTQWEPPLAVEADVGPAEQTAPGTDAARAADAQHAGLAPQETLETSADSTWGKQDAAWGDWQATPGAAAAAAASAAAAAAAEGPGGNAAAAAEAAPASSDSSWADNGSWERWPEESSGAAEPRTTPQEEWQQEAQVPDQQPMAAVVEEEPEVVPFSTEDSEAAAEAPVLVEELEEQEVVVEEVEAPPAEWPVQAEAEAEAQSQAQAQAQAQTQSQTPSWGGWPTSTSAPNSNDPADAGWHGWPQGGAQAPEQIGSTARNPSPAVRPGDFRQAAPGGSAAPQMLAEGGNQPSSGGWSGGAAWGGWGAGATGQQGSLEQSSQFEWQGWNQEAQWAATPAPAPRADLAVPIVTFNSLHFLPAIFDDRRSTLQRIERYLRQLDQYMQRELEKAENALNTVAEQDLKLVVLRKNLERAADEIEQLESDLRREQKRRMAATAAAARARQQPSSKTEEQSKAAASKLAEQTREVQALKQDVERYKLLNEVCGDRPSESLCGLLPSRADRLLLATIRRRRSRRSKASRQRSMS